MTLAPLSDSVAALYVEPTLVNGRPDVLHVACDTTPGPHRTDSDDIYWWLPAIGPTATVLAVTLARRSRCEGCVQWSPEDLALRVGLGGRVTKLWSGLERLDRFGVARFHSPDVLTIRLQLPALTDRQLSRMPVDMAAAYPQGTVGT